MKFILLALVVALTACDFPNSEENSADTKTSQREQTNNTQRTPTLFDAQIDAMGKAESVEDTVLKAQQDRTQQMQDL